MAIGIGRRDAGLAVQEDVRVLSIPDIPSLRLGWQHRHDHDEIAQMLRIFPGRSVWLPDTREFVLLGPWRHRMEIASVVEVAAIRNAELLIGAATAAAHAGGARLALMAEIDERRRPAFYDRMGYVELEEVVTYEIGRPVRMPTTTFPLTFVQVAGHDTEMLEAVLDLDHRSFPWLWWNSSEELAVYSFLPGVAIYAGILDSRVVAYVGVTSYPGWGHLDRIAVDPDYQGRGLGQTTLDFALGTLSVRGARRIGLSTQRENHRSQHLYERIGFKRSRSQDYRLYGRWADGGAITG